jgi:hypothetical protein
MKMARLTVLRATSSRWPRLRSLRKAGRNSGGGTRSARFRLSPIGCSRRIGRRPLDHGGNVHESCHQEQLHLGNAGYRRSAFSHLVPRDARPPGGVRRSCLRSGWRHNSPTPNACLRTAYCGTKFVWGVILAIVSARSFAQFSRSVKPTVSTWVCMYRLGTLSRPAATPARVI